jgi:hypothetical protein
LADEKEAHFGIAAGGAGAIEGGGGEIAARGGPAFVSKSLTFQARHPLVKNPQQGLIKIGHTRTGVAIPIFGSDRHLTHEVDQIALDLLDEVTGVAFLAWKECLGHAEANVELINSAIGDNAYVRFCDTAAEKKRGCSIITSFSCYAVHLSIKDLTFIEKQPIKIS